MFFTFYSIIVGYKTIIITVIQSIYTFTTLAFSKQNKKSQFHNNHYYYDLIIIYTLKVIIIYITNNIINIIITKSLI